MADTLDNIGNLHPVKCEDEMSITVKVTREDFFSYLRNSSQLLKIHSDVIELLSQYFESFESAPSLSDDQFHNLLPGLSDHFKQGLEKYIETKSILIEIINLINESKGSQ